MKKMSPWDHVHVAHTHLLFCYASIDPSQYYADAITRGMRACALALGQIPRKSAPRNKSRKFGTSHNSAHPVRRKRK